MMQDAADVNELGYTELDEPYTLFKPPREALTTQSRRQAMSPQSDTTLHLSHIDSPIATRSWLQNGFPDNWL